MTLSGVTVWMWSVWDSFCAADNLTEIDTGELSCRDLVSDWKIEKLLREDNKRWRGQDPMGRPTYSIFPLVVDDIK